MSGKVAFITWEYLDTNVAAARRQNKLHMGWQLPNGNLRSSCRLFGTAATIRKDRMEIFKGKVEKHRICKHCYKRDAAFWNSLMTKTPTAQPLEKGLTLFISWSSYEYETQARNDGKLHVGKKVLGSNLESRCQSHWTKSIYKTRYVEVSAKNYPTHRYCRFCLEKYPQMFGLSKPIVSKQTLPQAGVNEVYVLIYPKDQKGHTATCYDFVVEHALRKGGLIESKLKRNPQMLKDIRTGRVRLYRCYSVAVEFETEEVVKSVRFDE